MSESRLKGCFWEEGRLGLCERHTFFTEAAVGKDSLLPQELQGISMGHPLRGLAWGFIAKGSWVGTARVSCKQLCLQQLVSSVSQSKDPGRWQGYQTSPQLRVHYTRKMGPAVEGSQRTQTTEPTNGPVLLCAVTQSPQETAGQERVEGTTHVLFPVPAPFSSLTNILAKARLLWYLCRLPVWLPKRTACHASKVTCAMPHLCKAAILNNVWERRSFPDPCQPSSCSCSQSLLLLRTVPGQGFHGALALMKFLYVLLTQAPLSLARDGLITGGRNLIKLADEKK